MASTIRYDIDIGDIRKKPGIFRKEDRILLRDQLGEDNQSNRRQRRLVLLVLNLELHMLRKQLVLLAK